MEYLVPKAPDDTVFYFADWSKQIGEDSIATFELVVTAGTITIPQPPRNHGEFLRFLVAGGAEGEMATLSCTIHTRGKQDLTRELQLYISSGAESVTPSTATKRTVIAMVFEEVGLASYEFDATPEENASLLRRMDAMMAEWRTSGLDLNYNAPPVIGASDLDDESGLPDDAVQAVALQLAKRFAPLIGKTLSAETRTDMSRSWDLLLARYMPKVERQLPHSTPLGAGNKPWSVWWPYAGSRGRRGRGRGTP